jgi:hypothetical protein
MTWALVLDPYTGSYAKGIDREKLYQFRRGADGEVESFRLSETGPYFNIAGLYWRDPFSARDSGSHRNGEDCEAG